MAAAEAKAAAEKAAAEASVAAKKAANERPRQRQRPRKRRTRRRRTRRRRQKGRRRESCCRAAAEVAALCREMEAVRLAVEMSADEVKAAAEKAAADAMHMNADACIRMHKCRFRRFLRKRHGRRHGKSVMFSAVRPDLRTAQQMIVSCTTYSGKTFAN
jgi:hypothetical protein